LALLFPSLTVLAACIGASQSASTPTLAPSKPAATVIAPATASIVPSVSAIPIVSPAPSAAAYPVASPAASPAVVAPSPSAVGATTAPSSEAVPTATVVAEPENAWIGNTDGGGVYLRNSPHDGDRADVLGDGTKVTITGGQVEGDGQEWYPVKTADNTAGYVPIAYLTMTEPKDAPAAPTGEPK
jgi:hypothetical protein